MILSIKNLECSLLFGSFNYVGLHLLYNGSHYSTLIEKKKKATKFVVLFFFFFLQKS